jgi:hypothetical protein
MDEIMSEETRRCKSDQTIFLTALIVPMSLAVVIGIVLITTGKLAVEKSSKFWFVIMEIIGSILLTAGVVTAASLMPVILVNTKPC